MGGNGYPFNGSPVPSWRWLEGPDGLVKARLSHPSTRQKRWLVLAKNTIRKNNFWIYPNTYEYDTALDPPSEYEYGWLWIWIWYGYSSSHKVTGNRVTASYCVHQNQYPAITRCPPILRVYNIPYLTWIGSLVQSRGVKGSVVPSAITRSNHPPKKDGQKKLRMVDWPQQMLGWMNEHLLWLVQDLPGGLCIGVIAIITNRVKMHFLITKNLAGECCSVSFCGHLRQNHAQRCNPFMKHISTIFGALFRLKGGHIS
jgi:hypothetical protein